MGSEAPLSRVQNANRTADIALVACAAVIAVIPRTGHDVVAAAFLAAFGVCTLICTARVLRHYDAHNGRSGLGDAALTLVLVAVIAAAVWIAGRMGVAWVTPGEGHRFIAIAAPGLLALRWALVGASLSAFPEKWNALVVGTGPLGRHTGIDLESRPDRSLIGHLTWTEEGPCRALRAPVLGSAEELEAILREQVIDEVYLAFNRNEDGAIVQRAIDACERLGTPFAVPACTFRLARAVALDKKAVGDGYVHYACVEPKRVQHRVKRAVDILVSGTALLLLAPLLAAVAAAIKLTSCGPVLFRQERVGLHGRHFRMLKFRSMVVNAEALKAALVAKNERRGPAFKLTHDPRVTSVGRFIRKYSIDELPQLVNILRGDMSIVGPRPPLPNEVARYEGWQRRRLSVRPGLTCVWQVSGRGGIPFEQWMLLDLAYIDHWSLADDLSLIMRTVPVVLTGRGAS